MGGQGARPGVPNVWRVLRALISRAPCRRGACILQTQQQLFPVLDGSLCLTS